MLFLRLTTYHTRLFNYSVKNYALLGSPFRCRSTYYALSYLADNTATICTHMYTRTSILERGTYACTNPAGVHHSWHGDGNATW